MVPKINALSIRPQGHLFAHAVQVRCIRVICRAKGMLASSCSQSGIRSSFLGTTRWRGQELDVGIYASGRQAPQTCGRIRPPPRASSKPRVVIPASDRGTPLRVGFRTTSASSCCHGSVTEQQEPHACSTGGGSNEVRARQAVYTVPPCCGGCSPPVACAIWVIT